jgi:hypothetical protein
MNVYDLMIPNAPNERSPVPLFPCSPVPLKKAVHVSPFDLLQSYTHLHLTAISANPPMTYPHYPHTHNGCVNSANRKIGTTTHLRIY